jgi:membrane protease subunit HflK
MYVDAMQQMFSNTSKVLVDSKGGNNLLYLPLDKLIQQSNTDPATVTAPRPAVAPPPAPEPAAPAAEAARSRDALRNRDSR